VWGPVQASGKLPVKRPNRIATCGSITTCHLYNVTPPQSVFIIVTIPATYTHVLMAISFLARLYNDSKNVWESQAAAIAMDEQDSVKRTRAATFGEQIVNRTVMRVEQREEAKHIETATMTGIKGRE
jgi:hypothetical protein